MTVEVSSKRERTTIYLLAGAVFAALALVALFVFRAAESTQQAQAKADQLIAALEQAGVQAPSQDQIVRVLGDDGGALCDNPSEGLRKSILLSQLVNGSGGPGTRPVIADSRVVKGQLLVIGIYCPNELPRFQEFVNTLKLEEGLVK